MDKSTCTKVALLSVHPRYADAILQGTKTVEFRKRPLSPTVTHVAIYATKPVGKVVGVFSVAEQITDNPFKLWAKFKEVGGISRDRFLDYFKGREQGVGIRVEDLVPLEEHLSLEEAFGISRAPQSFQYFLHTEASISIFGAIARCPKCALNRGH